MSKTHLAINKIIFVLFLMIILMITILITENVYANDENAERQQTLDGTRIAVNKETKEQIINKIEIENKSYYDAIWGDGTENPSVNIENVVRYVCRQILRLSRWIDLGISEENQEKFVNHFEITYNHLAWVSSKTDKYSRWLDGVDDEYNKILDYIIQTFPEYALSINDNLSGDNNNSVISSSSGINESYDHDSINLGIEDPSDSSTNQHEGMGNIEKLSKDISFSTANFIGYIGMSKTSPQNQEISPAPTPTATPIQKQSPSPDIQPSLDTVTSETTIMLSSTNIDDENIPGSNIDKQNGLLKLVIWFGLIFVLLSSGGFAYIYKKMINISKELNIFRNKNEEYDLSINKLIAFEINKFPTNNKKLNVIDDIGMSGIDQRQVTKLNKNDYDYKKNNDEKIRKIENDITEINKVIKTLQKILEMRPSPTPTTMPDPRPKPTPSPYPTLDPSEKIRHSENELIEELVSYYNDVMNKRLSYRDFEKAFTLKACNINAFSERQSFSIHDDYEDRYFWTVIFENAMDSERCYIVPSLRKIISDKSRTSGFNTSGINGLFHPWETTDLSISVLIKPAVFEYKDKKFVGDQPIQQGILRININSGA